MSSSKSPDKAERPLKEIEVLLVDDEFHTREMMRQVFKQIGVGKVHLAENGRDAVNLLVATKGRIKMLFLDLDMPVMGGFTCLKVIRAAPDPTIAEIPVVILTAYAGLPQLEKSADLGISGFLSKPVSIKTLKESISQALRNERIDPAALAKLF